MNPLELRYEILKALEARPDLPRVFMNTTAPGQPISLTVRTIDPYDNPRTYTLTIEETD